MFNNKGFGFIELIAVMAVVSILVIFAIPKYEGFIEYSKESELKQEIRKVEYDVKKDLIKIDVKDWEIMDNNEQVELWTSTGKKTSDLNNVYYKIPDSMIETTLEGGEFYMSNGGLFYSINKMPTKEKEITKDEVGPDENKIDKEKLKELINEASKLNEKDYESGWKALNSTIVLAQEVYNSKSSSQEKVERTYKTLLNAINQLTLMPEKPLPDAPGLGGEETPKPGDSSYNWELANDEDFYWVKEKPGYEAYGKKDKGHFRYVGNKEYVIIPEVIQGHKMNNYRKMFESNKIVKAVASTNPNIYSMEYMFTGIKLVSLDVSHLNTSNTLYFSRMFLNAKLDNFLILNNWDTKKALYLDDMFYNTKTPVLSISGFNTDNAIYMQNMFRKVKIRKLNLSDFNVDNVVYLNSMLAEIEVEKICVKDRKTAERLLKEAFDGDTNNINLITVGCKKR